MSSIDRIAREEAKRRREEVERFGLDHVRELSELKRHLTKCAESAGNAPVKTDRDGKPGQKGKPGPKGPHALTARRKADINIVAKECRKKPEGWETNAAMRLNEMKTPFPSKRLEVMYRDKDHLGGNWLKWLRMDRTAFLKQWSRDVKSA